MFLSTAIIGTGADLAETNLLSYSVPANTLRNNGDSIEFDAEFAVDATATVATKTIKVYWGATVILQFGDAALDGGIVRMRGRIVRTGAINQLTISDYVTTNTALTATVKTQSLAPGETLSGAVLLKCTGQNGTNMIAGGVQQLMLVVDYRAA